MHFAYLLRQMLRQKAKCALVLGSGLVLALLLCVLHIGDLRMDRQIEQVYDNTRVLCEVTNLTGTQSENLDLPVWVLRVFSPELLKQLDAYQDFQMPEDEIPFSRYLTDIQVKTALTGGKCHQSPVTIHGLTSLDAARELRTEAGRVITWQDGFDEGIFLGDAPLCLIPQDLGGAVTDGAITVDFGADRAERLQVAGTYVGGASKIYCSWTAAVQAAQRVEQPVAADSIHATLRDNRKIAEFRDVCASRWFAEPNSKGTPTPWAESAAYESYPYALAIYDDTLEKTVGSLKQNQQIFRFCMKAIAVLSLGISFLISHLMIRQREKTLALQRLLGRSKVQIFLEASVEYISLSTAGFLLGLILPWAFSGVRPPWAYVLTGYGTGCVGAVMAVSMFLRRDLMQSLKGAE